MNLKTLMNRMKYTPFGEDIIAYLSNDGNHIGASGKVIPALTDERLKLGDHVITVTDENGRTFIIGGKK
jgi:hypothetical protein